MMEGGEGGREGCMCMLGGVGGVEWKEGKTVMEEKRGMKKRRQNKTGRNTKND